MEINCPSCGEVILVADEDLGNKIECPSCQQSIEIGDSSANDSLPNPTSSAAGDESASPPPTASTSSAKIKIIPPPPPPDDHFFKRTADPDREPKKWAMFIHISIYSGFVIPIIGWLIVPILIWQMKKDEYSYVDKHGKIVFNWLINQCIIGLPCAIFVVPLLVFIPYCLIIPIVGGIKANKGELWSYPSIFQFFK